jgi:hypothetical protein
MLLSRPKFTGIPASLLAVALFLGVSFTPATLRAEDPSFIALAKSYLDRALKSVSQYLEEPTAQAPKSDPDEIARRAVLEQVLRKIFLIEKGYHFTQSRWGAQPVPYQIDGLTTVELPGSPLNSSDYSAGIDRRITYDIEVKAFRTFSEIGGWGKWQKGKPPHLEGITLVRQSGTWKVSVAPTSAYSIR